MSSHDTDLARTQSVSDLVSAQIEEKNLKKIFAVFPEDVLTAMEQAVRYNRSIAEQKIPQQFIKAADLPGPNP
jgi:hypothetical protein